MVCMARTTQIRKDSGNGELNIACDIPDAAHELNDKMMAKVFSKVRSVVLKRLGGYQISWIGQFAMRR